MADLDNFDSASDGNGHTGNRNAAMPVVVNLLGDAQEIDTSQSVIQVDTTTSVETSGIAGGDPEPTSPEQRDQRQGQVQLHEFIGSAVQQYTQPQLGFHRSTLTSRVTAMRPCPDRFLKS